MRKVLVLLPIFFCIIACSSFDWGAFNQGVQNALITQTSQRTASQLSGSVVIAGDGEYLGKIANQYDTDSIFNEYGTYGSKYAAKSIWNQYGTYGSKFSNYSAFNPYAASPPKIYKDGAFVAYLTVKKNVANAINPYVLLSHFR